MSWNRVLLIFFFSHFESRFYVPIIFRFAVSCFFWLHFECDEFHFKRFKFDHKKCVQFWFVATFFHTSIYRWTRLFLSRKFIDVMCRKKYQRKKFLEFLSNTYLSEIKSQYEIDCNAYVNSGQCHYCFNIGKLVQTNQNNDCFDWTMCFKPIINEFVWF